MGIAFKDTVFLNENTNNNTIKDALSKINIGMYVLQDVNISVDEIKAFIDFVIITPAHAYLTSICNDDDLLETYELKANKNVETIKYYRDKKRSGILNALNRFIGKDVYYKPLVIINNKQSDFGKSLVNINDLEAYFVQDIDGTSIMDLDSKDTMYNMAQYILLANSPIIENSSLENDLKNFSTKKAFLTCVNENDILNDLEIKRLLELKPKNINELFNCLDANKIKVYGDDILQIINKLKKE